MEDEASVVLAVKVKDEIVDLEIFFEDANIANQVSELINYGATNIKDCDVLEFY